MTDDLGRVAGTTAGWIVTYGLHSSVLLIVAWAAVRFGWVRRPATVDHLWKFCLVAGVVTATASALQPQEAVAGRVVAKVERIAVREGPGPQPHLEGTLAWEGDGPALAGSLPPEMRGRLLGLAAACGGPIGSAERRPLPADVDIRCGPVPAPVWPTWLTGSVLLGALAGLLAFGLRWIDLSRLRRTFRPASPETERSLERLIEGTRVRARVVVSPLLGSPCVVDGRTIALPERCADEVPADELDAILAHEVAHLSRRDVAWARFTEIFARIFWFQPLNRVALREIRRAAEWVCDDWALERTGEPVGLARSISRVASWGASPYDDAVVAMARGGHQGLSHRVQRILDGTTRPGIASRTQRALAGAVMLGFLWLLPDAPRPTLQDRAILLEAEATSVDVRRFDFKGADGEESHAVVLTRVRMADDSDPADF